MASAVAAIALVSGCNSTGKDAGQAIGDNESDYPELIMKGYFRVFQTGVTESGSNSQIFAVCHERIKNLITGEQLNRLLSKGVKLDQKISESRTSQHRSILAADPNDIKQKDGAVNCSYLDARVRRNDIDALKGVLGENAIIVEQELRSFMSKRMPLVDEAVRINEEIKMLNDELTKTL